MMKILKLIIPSLLICCHSLSDENSHSLVAKEIKFSLDLKIIEDYMKGADAKYLKSELLKKNYSYRGPGQVYHNDTLKLYWVPWQERVFISRHLTHFEQLAKSENNHFPHYLDQFHSLYLDSPDQILIKSKHTNMDSLDNIYFTKNNFIYMIKDRMISIYYPNSDIYVDFANSILKENKEKLILLDKALHLDKDNERARRMKDSLLIK